MDYSQVRIQSRWLYLALFLSLIAIISHNALPVAQYPLLTIDSQVSIYTDAQQDPPGTSEGYWLDQSKRRFRCIFQPDGPGFSYCGFNTMIGDGHAQGEDLSRYQTLKIKLNYKGNAEVLRLYFRNFSAGVSDINNSPSTAKYIRMIVPTRDIANGISLPLKQFTLADWWLRDMHLPTELAQVEFENVIHAGIDFPYPVTPGAHDVEVEEMVLEGEWVSRETWYMCILVFWFLLLTITNMLQLVRYHRMLAARSAELNEARNKANRLEEQTRHYQALSMLDQLTNTLNRRGIERQYKLLHLAQRWQNSAILLIDIDHFKRVNDIYGHETGDTVLISIARLVKEDLYGHDEIGRWGGEEFLVICPTASEENARSIAERFRVKIENERFAPPHKLRITASIGVTMTNQCDSFESAFRRVDQAMYTAKQQGRNKVFFLPADRQDIDTNPETPEPGGSAKSLVD